MKKTIFIYSITFYVISIAELIFCNANNKVYFVITSTILCLIFLIISYRKIEKVDSNINLMKDKLLRKSNSVAMNGDRLIRSAIYQELSMKKLIEDVNDLSAEDKKNYELLYNAISANRSQMESINKGAESFVIMEKAIKIIHDYNNKIIFQISKNENDFSKVIKLINTINEKTNAINGIAIQSKILSFNASVEASRAGEHGKGFSIVAQEISILASSSLEAAKDIKAVLAESIEKTNEILRSGQKEMGDIVADALEHIMDAEKVANECNIIFRKISNDFAKYNSELNEATGEASLQQDRLNKIFNTLDAILVKINTTETIAKDYYGISHRMITHPKS